MKWCNKLMQISSAVGNPAAACRPRLCLGTCKPGHSFFLALQLKKKTSRALGKLLLVGKAELPSVPNGTNCSRAMS